MRLLHVVGARPNFMKAAAVMRAARTHEQILVHTGQHYDAAMSRIFFDELQLPEPDHHLGVGSGSHAQQTAHVMLALEPILVEKRPDWVVVVGDVNSTAAAALVARKLDLRVAHVEAGLRSFDRAMPEEQNRVVTDALADLLLTPSPDGDRNLRREGRPAHCIRHVGNVMIDILDAHIDEARARQMARRFEVAPGDYAVATLHRARNVDDLATLERLLDHLRHVGTRLPVIFPVHPRTRARIEALDATHLASHALRLVDPLGYVDFIGLLADARLALTDSGGIQEESTVLGVPCLTLRDNTERPITITEGTNVLCGSDGAGLRAALDRALLAAHSPRRPALWDGHAGERVVAALMT